MLNGQSATATLGLTEPAAQNELIDLASSDPTDASVPASVTIAAGQSSASFTISTRPVNPAEKVTITAIPDSSSGLPADSSLSGHLTVGSLLKSVSITPNPITGGRTATGTITFAQAAPANITPNLKSDTQAITVGSTVQVAAGATSATFPITTTPVVNNIEGTIRVSDNLVQLPAQLKVVPPIVSNYYLSKTTYYGAGTVTGIVQAERQGSHGGFTLRLESNNAAATVPNSVTVAQGATSATFSVQVNKVSSITKVTITETAPNGAAQSALLVVYP